jgi:hypothetical protein
MDINAIGISKHNKGLAKPIGIKVKEKTVRGSRRPVSCFEKEIKRKKKSTYATVQQQPKSIKKLA